MASWKKVIVSGSDAAFNSAAVGSNQSITTNPTSTKLSGSFSGSFFGDGRGLSGVPAAFPDTAVTNNQLNPTDKIYVSDGASKFITYSDLIGDLAGTNLTAEAGVGGNDSLALSSTLSNLQSVSATQFNATSITGSLLGNVTGNLTGTASWADYVVNGTGGNLKVSGSIGGVATAGTTVNLDQETLAINGTVNQINTTVTDNTVTIGFPNNVTIPQNLVVSNNLTVNGTTTSVTTQNLTVADRYILLASSSNPGNFDSGIIVSRTAAGSPVTQSGWALYMDQSGGDATARWAVSSSVPQNATNVTPEEYVVTAKSAAGAPPASPTYGGTANGYGNMFISTDNNGEIWIYA